MLTVPQVGVVRVTWPISTFWGPGHIFGADKAKHFKFGLQIERKDYWRHVKVLQHGGAFIRSRDLLKFSEISANISEMVQDRHIVTRLTGNYIYPIK